jgi:hypothetical protein
LNVEKNEVGFFAFDFGGGGLTVSGFADNFKIRFRFQQTADSAPRQRLVVNN